MRRIRVVGDGQRVRIGGIGGGMKELLFTGLLYSGKTPGGPCDKFQDFERNDV